MNNTREQVQLENGMSEANTAVAEWVLPGHPDKLCDALADRIVGEVIRVDHYGQCGIEAACAFDHVFVTGLIGFDRGRLPDIGNHLSEWVRDTYRSAGYGGRWDPLPEALHRSAHRPGAARPAA